MSMGKFLANVFGTTRREIIATSVLYATGGAAVGAAWAGEFLTAGALVFGFFVGVGVTLALAPE